MLFEAAARGAYGGHFCERRCQVAVDGCVLRIVLDTDAGVVRLLVCSEDPAADTTACAVGGARLLASADYPSSVTTVLGGSTLTATTSPLKVELDNRGGLIAPASTAYTLSRGASQNDETGNLQ